MKKSIRILFCLLLVLSVALCVLTACNNNEQTTPSEPQKLEIVGATAEVIQEDGGDVLSIEWSKANGATNYVVTVALGDDVNEVNKTANELSHKYTLEQDGSYTVTVKAVGDGINYTDSDIVTKIVQYVKQTTPPPADEPTKLTAPQNLKYDKDTKLITWDAVEHAKEYELKLNDVTYITEKCSLNMTNRDDGDYTFTVKAIGDGKNYLNSDEATITFTKEKKQVVVEKKELGRVFGLTISDTDIYNRKEITWNSVKGADGYELTFDNDTNKQVIIVNNALIYVFEGELGLHTIDIRAIADEDNELYYSSTRIMGDDFTIKEPEKSSVTYQDVIDKLNNNIKSTMIQLLGGEEGFIYRGILTIDADTEMGYFLFNLDGNEYMSPINLSGANKLNSLEELMDFITNYNYDFLQNVKINGIMSDEEALQLVSRAIEKNQLTSSISINDIKWCMATDFASNGTNITIITNDNQKITYHLYVQGSKNEYLAGEVGYWISNEQTTQYNELSQLFEDNQQ